MAEYFGIVLFGRIVDAARLGRGLARAFHGGRIAGVEAFDIGRLIDDHCARRLEARGAATDQDRAGQAAVARDPCCHRAAGTVPGDIDAGRIDFRLIPERRDRRTGVVDPFFGNRGVAAALTKEIAVRRGAFGVPHAGNAALRKSPCGFAEYLVGTNIGIDGPGAEPMKERDRGRFSLAGGQGDHGRHGPYAFTEHDGALDDAGRRTGRCVLRGGGQDEKTDQQCEQGFHRDLLFGRRACDIRDGAASIPATDV